jgi:type IV pilus assembly protein PilV
MSINDNPYLKRHRQGFSLIEALVTLVIFAIGMMAIARMLLISHRTNTSNYLRQQAVQSAYDIIDRMRANRQASLNGSYVVSNIVTTGTPTQPSSPSTNCDSTACTTTQLATYDVWYWLAKDVAQMPNGCGAVVTALSGSDTIVTVTVQWDDSLAQKTFGVTNAAPSQLILQTKL